MESEITVALLALVGTLIGSLAGIVTSNRLTNYRIKQLEAKVDKHNNFAGRMPVIEEQMKVVDHRITDIERKLEND